MPKSRNSRKLQPEPKRARLPALIAFTIGILALVAFVVLDRKMAPPFPNFPTNAVPAKAGASTNATAKEANSTNTISAFSTDLFAENDTTNRASTAPTKEVSFESDPGEIVAKYIAEGNQALNAGQNNAAVESYRKAVETLPTDEDAHFNLGIALSRAGKTAEAKKAYEKALELFADYTEVHINLGNLLMNEKDNAGAEGHFKKALTLSPENPSAHNSYGTFLARQGNTIDAIKHFSEALRVQPDHIQARVNLANAYTSLNRLEDASRELSIVLKMEPNYRPAQTALVNLRKRMGR